MRTRMIDSLRLVHVSGDRRQYDQLKSTDVEAKKGARLADAACGGRGLCFGEAICDRDKLVSPLSVQSVGIEHRSLMCPLSTE